MPQYGEVRVDYITYTTGVAPNEGNVTVPVSGLVNAPTFSGDVIIEGDLEVNGDLTVSGDINASGVTISGFTGLFASGTAASPSISFVGDDDTGIYSPAANQVAITTSGTGRLFVDNVGNVGVGTITPDKLLHIEGDTPEFKGTNTNSISGGTEQVFKFGIEGQVDSVYGPAASIIFRQDDASWDSANANQKSTRIEFCTQDSTITDTSETPRLVIDQGGLVGIGTDDPQAPLHIASAYFNPFILEQTSNGTNYIQFKRTTVDQGYIGEASGGTDFSVFNQQTGSLRFGTNNNLRMEIDSSGNVGVGTGNTTIKAFLDLKKDNDAGEGATLAIRNIGTGIGTSVAFYLVPNNGGGNDLARAASIESRQTISGNYADLGFFTANSDTPTEKMTITVGGNVGVGTTSPSHKLTVSGGNILLDSNNQLRFGTSDAAAIEASGADGTGGTRYMRFLVNDEKARIDSSGRLLVGASLSSNFIGTGFGAFLQVQESTSTLAMGIERPTDDTSGGSLNFRKTRSTTEGGVTPVQNNDNLGELRFAGTDGLGAILAVKISAQVDGTPAGPNPGPVSMPGRLVFSTTASGTSTPAERMRITSDGKVGIGTSSPSTRLEISESGGPKLSLLNPGVRSWTIGLAGTSNNADLLVKDETGSKNVLYLARNTGNVGIGTTSPGELLSLRGTNDTAFGISIASGTQAATIKQDASGNLDVNNNLGRALILSTSNAERARIDSSGRLLVGTSSWSSGARAVIAGNSSVSTGNGVLSISKGSNTAQVAGDPIANIEFTNSSAAVFARISVEADGTTGTTSDLPGRLMFWTTADGASSPTERMRISNNGIINLNTGGGSVDVGSGTIDGITIYSTSNPATGMIQTSTNGGPAMYLRRRTSDGTIIDFRRDTTSVGTISVTTTATTYNTSSDYRLKENVTPVTDGITRLQQLKPSRFNFIADPTKTVDGFLAHEVQAIVPEAITGEKDAVDDDGNPLYQGIDQSKIVPLVVAALQEAIAKIETLEQRLNDAGIN